MKTLIRFLILIFIFEIPLSFAGRWEKKGQVYITDRNQVITLDGHGVKGVYEYNGNPVYAFAFKEKQGRVFVVISERKSGEPRMEVPADQLTNYRHRQVEDN